MHIINSFKRIFSLERKIYINIFSLFSINIFRFLINIITLPHLIKVYGPNSWGKIVILQIIINYFIWLTDWSLDQHSSKLISINEGNQKNQQQIFKSSISAQLILLIISLILINIYGFLIAEYKEVFLYSNLIVIGNFMNPFWYLNGKEKIYETAIMQLLNKVIFAFLILNRINNNSLISEYFIYMGISSIIVGLFFLIILKFKYKINFFKYDFKSGLIIIRSSFKLFLSEIWGNFTNSIIPIVITNLIGNFELGIFNIADRIKSIAVQIMHPITYTLFPRMSKNYYKDKMNANQKFLKIILVTFIIGIFLILFINFNMYNVISFFSKENIEDINKVLKILMFSFLLNIIYEIFMNQYLIVNGLYKEIMQTKFIILIASILFGLPLIYNSGLYGAALTSIIYELIGLIYVIMLFIKTRNKKYILE